VLALAAAACAVALLWFRFRPGQGSSTAPAGVVLITIDTLRADHVGCYGDLNAATPVMDRLASTGVRFSHAVVQAPLTLPSHTSILTGVTPIKHGVRNNPDFVLGPEVPTLAEQFRAAGYRTAAFVSGFTLHSRFGLDRGFDAYDDRFPRGDDPSQLPYIERRADATVAAATRWLEAIASDPVRPFFLWVHLFDPHAPYDPPEPFRSRFADRPYDGEVAFADAQLGELIDAVRRIPGGRQTLVAVTSDHGEGLGEHGEPTHGLFVYDSTIRVPLILSGPGVAAARTVSTLAQSIDIAPTLLDLEHLPPLPGADGRSLVPAITGSRSDASETAYVESLYARLSFGWAPLHGWREGNWMYIDAPRPELYEVAADPGQLHDLAAARPAETARFHEAVQAAISKTRTVSPAAVSRSDAERLRSLGYASGGPIAKPSLRDPKDLAQVVVRIENAMALERVNPKEAAEEFRAVLAQDPDNPLARRHLAIALSTARRFGEAIVELNALIAAGNANADTLTFLSDCYRLAGELERSLEAGREAQARDSRIPDAPNAVAKTLVALGRRDEARREFEHALSLQADDPDALEGLADLAIERGDFSEAKARLEALRTRDAADVGLALKLGTILVRMSELAPAIQLFEGAVRDRPANVNALVSLAGALAKAGRPAEAVPYFERAVSLGAVSPLVLNGLGFARLEAGDTARAAEALGQSLRLQPNQPAIAEALRQIKAGGRD
jgi:choline-sulfatase